MALSNIVREPRREITESVIGLAIVGPVIWADYEFGAWLERLKGYRPDGEAIFPWPVGMLVGVMFVAAAMLALVAAHAIGEIVCNRLERGGVRLRPRMRYR